MEEYKMLQTIKNISKLENGIKEHTETVIFYCEIISDLLKNISLKPDEIRRVVYDSINEAQVEIVERGDYRRKYIHLDVYIKKHCKKLKK